MRRATFLTICTMLVCSGCQTNPEKADRFIAPDPSFPSQFGKAVLYYIPNRFMDLIDIVHLGYGMGPGFGVELQLTRPVSIGAVGGADVGVAWLGRNTSPLQAKAYGRANISEWSVSSYEKEGATGPGAATASVSAEAEGRQQPQLPPYDKDRLPSQGFETEGLPAGESGAYPYKMWRFPRWDVGVHYHALLDHVYVGVALDEVVDFFVGWTTFDLKEDDFGR